MAQRRVYISLRIAEELDVSLGIFGGALFLARFPGTQSIAVVFL